MKTLAATLMMVLALPVFGEEPAVHVEVTAAPPDRSAWLVWHFQDQESLGLFVVEAQARKVFRDRGDCREAKEKPPPPSSSWWAWTIVGAVLGGAGVWAAKH